MTFLLIIILCGMNYISRQHNYWKMHCSMKSPTCPGATLKDSDRHKLKYGCHESWWRHHMETFFALLALCAGNSPVTCEFLAQRPVTRSFDVSFDLRLNKQSWCWWYETLSRSLWRHCKIHHNWPHIVRSKPFRKGRRGSELFWRWLTQFLALWINTGWLWE